MVTNNSTLWKRRTSLTTDWVSFVTVNAEASLCLQSASTLLNAAGVQIVAMIAPRVVWVRINWGVIMLMQDWIVMETLSTILGVWSHSKACYHHRILNTIISNSLFNKTVSHFIWQYLVNALNLLAKVKVLWYLLNSLPHNCSINDIFGSHITTRHSRCGWSTITKRIFDEGIGWYLRSWGENLPDFECTLKLDRFDSLQWIKVRLIVLNWVLRKTGRSFLNLYTSYVTDFACVERGDVARATTDGPLTDYKRLVALDLRSAVRWLIPRETLSYERVDIDAKVDPTVSRYHGVGDPSVHLISDDTLGSIAEHQSSSTL